MQLSATAVWMAKSRELLSTEDKMQLSATAVWMAKSRELLSTEGKSIFPSTLCNGTCFGDGAGTFRSTKWNGKCNTARKGTQLGVHPRPSLTSRSNSSYFSGYQLDSFPPVHFPLSGMKTNRWKRVVELVWLEKYDELDRVNFRWWEYDVRKGLERHWDYLRDVNGWGHGFGLENGRAGFDEWVKVRDEYKKTCERFVEWLV